jgi:WD40 repeat protein
VVAVAWTADGRGLLSGSWDRTIRLWDADRGNEIGRLGRFSHMARAVAVAPDGRRAAAGLWAPVPDAPALLLLALGHPPYIVGGMP